MKKIIEGVTYDTKKATCLGKFDSGFLKEDIRWSIIELYKTKQGNYFLHGSGGPGSPYGTYDNISETYGDGKVIMPISLKETIAWANEYLPNDELAALYKDMITEAKRLNLEVPMLLKDNMRKIAFNNKKKRLAEAKAKEDSKRRHRLHIEW